MQPTPPAQSSTETRDGIVWSAEQLEPEARATILAFAGKLSDPLAADFLWVLNRMESAYSYKALHQEDGAWRAISAHMPGLAPVLEVLRAHLQEDQPSCVTENPPAPFNRCTLARETGYLG